VPLGYEAEARKRRRLSIRIGVSAGMEDVTDAMVELEIWIPVEVIMRNFLGYGGIGTI
jgi:hypothetical protein